MDLIKSTDAASYLRALRQMMDEMGPHAALQPSMKRLLEILAETFGYKRAFLAIFDTETGTLKIGLTYSQPKVTQATYTPGQGIIGQVFQTGRPIVIPRMKDHAEFLNKAFGRSQEELASLAFISVPVLLPVRSGEREALGTLSVDIPTQSQEVLDSHCQFLEVVAGLVATQVARLQEEMALQRHLIAQGLMMHHTGEVNITAPDIVATSKSMRLVLQQVAQVAPSRATVLLRGESGTGKELLAEAIHAGSPRKDRPLIKLNCAALPSELIESELFGHEKGAFTGAVAIKKGLFELGHKGSLFLDEIGELSLEAQAKVLRAIQEKEIQRLGSEQTLSVDVRLITATHQPLEELLTEGRFREDLYYRINVFPIFIPSLRERREDILPIAEHFLGSFAQEYAKKIKRISTPAIDLLVQYHWPGNVRELRNCMERAVLICDEEVIRSYHLPPTLQTAESSATDSSLSFGESVAKFEQEILVDALKKAKGNMLQAARDLRVSYRIVNYKVKKYRIDPKKFTGSLRRRRGPA
ncbi:sigma 54-interacting transcriptional regulator [Desulfocurvibacter africanus]|uniref:Transcriptional regulator, NifA subfamily, Fis Family n=1 Tax=Desulfocurvibacter africanus subsp. africanus str. Walvis Bay TaxID=690850 RepID=F3YV90_DESAF|nr:sigma 54-interacting transcriptional regulator [Desulfocurvibacter africanus]EGJ48408.1 transcriptional regulator, NifA subfamily, Fis Family [Desulfocurvibacter africanus subsp. africanus str. Walvis Bay]